MDIGEMDSMEPIFSNLMEIWFDYLLSKLNLRFIHIKFFIHPENQLSHLREGNGILFRYALKNQNYFRVTYDYIESTYLRAPFFPKCADYYAHKSRGNCVERCYEHDYEKKYNLNPGVLSTRNYSEVKLRKTRFISYDHDLDIVCSKRCRISCQTIDYVSSIVNVFSSDEIPNTIAIPVASTRPYVGVYSVSKFSLSDFIIYIASITSLWLGASLYGTIKDWVEFLSAKISAHTQ